jgi:hypothetical protein
MEFGAGGRLKNSSESRPLDAFSRNYGRCLILTAILQSLNLLIEAISNCQGMRAVDLRNASNPLDA